MLKRIRKAMEEKDQGFTLIELLVVMIIIGILAAIAIPVFLNQRAKAQDTAVKNDLGILGKEISSYFIDGTTAPSVTIASNQYVVGTSNVGRPSSGNRFVTNFAAPLTYSATTATTTGWTAAAWCISLNNPNGSQQTFKYSAQNGLETGNCSSATAP